MGAPQPGALSRGLSTASVPKPRREAGRTTRPAAQSEAESGMSRWFINSDLRSHLKTHRKGQAGHDITRDVTAQQLAPTQSKLRKNPDWKKYVLLFCDCQNHRITESQNSRGWKGPLWVI